MQYRYVAPSSLRGAPRWGAKNVLPLNLIALLIGGSFFIPTSSGVSQLWYNEGMQRLVTSDW